MVVCIPHCQNIVGILAERNTVPDEALTCPRWIPGIGRKDPRAVIVMTAKGILYTIHLRRNMESFCLYHARMGDGPHLDTSVENADAAPIAVLVDVRREIINVEKNAGLAAMGSFPHSPDAPKCI